MFVVNEDNSIYATRGDIVFFSVTAEDDGKGYTFKAGDVVRIKVYGKKDAETVVMQKDFPVIENTGEVEIFLGEEDTKFGDVISKPTDYWYEVELNPGDNPQTIIGYDEDGAKVFRLFPEGDDIHKDEHIPTEEDIPFVDEALDLASPRPVANSAIAKELAEMSAMCDATFEAVAELHVTPQMFGAVGDGVADDTEAIQDAINSGHPVFIPNGIYAVTSLTIPKENPVDISGASTKHTVLKNVGNGSVFSCEGLSGYYYQDITLQNFSITSDYDVESVGENVCGLRFVRCARIRVANVLIQKQHTGVYVDGCWNMFYDNVTCYANRNGWVVDNQAGDVMGVANFHNKCTSNNNEIGVDVRGNYVFTWNGGEIGGNTYGVLLDSSGTGRVYNSCLANITMENNANPIVISKDGGTAPTNIEINNCYIFAYTANADSVAIKSYNCLRLSLINNFVSNYGTGVISHGYAATFIANNRLYNCAKLFVCGGNEYSNIGDIGAISRYTFSTFNNNAVLAMHNTPKTAIPNGGIVISDGVLKYKDSNGTLYKVTATAET